VKRGMPIRGVEGELLDNAEKLKIYALKFWRWTTCYIHYRKVVKG